MNCPKCGFEQPDGLIDCMRCGVIFSRLRGFSPPAQTPRAPSASPLAALGNDEIIPLAPAAETLYGGPPPPPPPPPQMYGEPGGPVARSFHAFDMGAALAETFRIYFANLFSLVLLTGMAFAPLLLGTAFFSAPKTQEEVAVAALVGLALQMLCGPLATAAVSFGVFQQMRGRDTTILACLSIGLGSLLTVVFVAALQGCAVFFGLLLCFIPGMILNAMYAVAVPAAVEERLSPFAALTRSSQLTDGNRWPVFGVLFILGLLTLGAGIASRLVGTVLFASSPKVVDFLQEGLTVALSGLTATASAVMYYRLRSARESIDVENIASVFD